MKPVIKSSLKTTVRTVCFYSQVYQQRAGPGITRQQVRHRASLVRQPRADLQKPVAAQHAEQLDGGHVPVDQPGELELVEAVSADDIQRVSAAYLYDHNLTTGWFDKFLPWRRHRAPQLDRMVLICPSDAFIASLPERYKPLFVISVP